MRRGVAAVIGALIVVAVALLISARGPVEKPSAVPATDNPKRAADPAIASPAPQRAPTHPRKHAGEETSTTRDAEAAVESVVVRRGRAVLDDGRPAVGARIRSFAFQQDGCPSEDATTDADGRFEIRGREGARVLYGVLRGRATASFYSPNPDEEVALTFVAGGVVSGTAYDAVGRAMPSARLRLVRCGCRGRVPLNDRGAVWSIPQVAEFCTPATTTDPTGRFRFEGAPLMPEKNGVARCCVVVFDDADGKSWRSDVARFETSGTELVRDVHAGSIPFNSQDPDPLREVAGVVTETDGKPVAHAVIRYVAVDDGWGEDMRVALADARGAFEISMEEGFHADGRALELRVDALGYLPWRGPRTGDVARVRLQRTSSPPRDGSIRGKILGSDGKPIVGPTMIRLAGEFSVFETSVRADRSGGFVLDGLWPGEWTVSFDADEKSVVVADGGVVTVELRAGADAETFVTSSRSRAPDGPTRDVVLVGLPSGEPAIVSAYRRTETRTAAVVDGQARFSDLAQATWAFTVERPYRANWSRVFEVLPGDGPQTIAFDAR